MVAITVASVSCRVDTGSVEANFATLERWARRAASARATLALFPEGFLSGYPLAASSRASVAERAIRLPGPVTDRLAALSSRRSARGAHLPADGQFACGRLAAQHYGGDSLVVGSEVEVKNVDEGFENSWTAAKVLKIVKVRHAAPPTLD